MKFASLVFLLIQFVANAADFIRQTTNQILNVQLVWKPLIKTLLAMIVKKLLVLQQIVLSEMYITLMALVVRLKILIVQKHRLVLYMHYLPQKAPIFVTTATT